MKLNNKTLAIIAACLFVITIFLYSGISIFRTRDVHGSYLLQRVDTSAIAAITIQSGDDLTTINGTATGFHIKELDSYPASMEKVNQLLITLMDARINREVSTNPDYFHEYSVASDSENAKIVTLLNAEGETIGGVVVGISGEAEPGPYVRMIQDQTVYSLTRNMSIFTDAMAYIDKSPFEFETEDVVKVSAASASESFSVVRDEEGVFVLGQEQNGDQVNAYEVSSLINSVASLNIEAIKKATDQQLKWDHSLSLEFKSGFQFVITSAVDGADIYVSLSALPPKEQEIYLNQDDDEEQLKEKEAYFLDKKKATSFNLKHGGFIYKVSTETGTKLRSTLADLTAE